MPVSGKVPELPPVYVPPVRMVDGNLVQDETWRQFYAELIKFLKGIT